MIAWADVIFVMERKHQQILKQLFPEALNGKHLVDLDIEDNYRFGDAELVDMLKVCLQDYL